MDMEEVSSDSYKVCFHFDPPESEWSKQDVDDFVTLMLTGDCQGTTKKPISTLAQSKVRKIGEKDGRPIDRLAWLVAKKLTCRICGKLDFSTQMNRRVHETQCRGLARERARRERRERADSKIFKKHEGET